MRQSSAVFLGTPTEPEQADDGSPAPPHEAEPPAPHRRAPLALAALATGIIVSRFGLTRGAEALGRDEAVTAAISSSALLGTACAGLIVAALCRGRACAAALLLSTTLIGAGVFTWRCVEVRGDGLSAWAPGPGMGPGERDERTTIVVDGQVTEIPRIDPGRPDAQTPGRGSGPTTRFALATDAVETPEGWVPVTGVLRVVVRDEVANLGAGDRIRVRAEWRPLRGPLNPGEDDERLWAAQESRVGSAVVASAGLVQPLPPATSGPARFETGVIRGLAVLRSGAARWLETALESEDESGATSGFITNPARAMLAALLIGREERALEPVTGAFSRLGLVHILSISGFHLVVLAGLIGFLVRLTGDRGRLEPLIVGGVIGMYLLIVPAEAPVLRSGIMVLAFLVAEAAGRRYDRLNLLALIAGALLLWRPLDLFAPGFQLSFIVTAALLACGEPLRRRWFAPRLRGGLARHPRTILAMIGHAIVRMLQGGAASSVLAWTVSAPIVLYHAGLVSPAAPATGFVLTMVFTVVMWVGAITLTLAALSATVAGVAGAVLGALGTAATWACMGLDGLPGMAVGMPQVSILWTIGATVTGLMWVRGGWSSPGERIRRHLATTLVLAWLTLTLVSASRAASGGGVVIDAFAGRGREAHPAILVRGGDQAVAVLGKEATAAEVSRVLGRGVRAVGAWRVRSVVITGDGRTLSALPELTARLGLTDVHLAESVLTMMRERPRLAESIALAACEARGVRVHAMRPGVSLALSPEVALDLHAGLPTVRLQSAGGSVVERSLEALLQSDGAESVAGAPRYRSLRMDVNGAVSEQAVR